MHPAGTWAERDAMINSHPQQRMAANRRGHSSVCRQTQHCEAMFLFTAPCKVLIRTFAEAVLNPMALATFGSHQMKPTND